MISKSGILHSQDQLITLKFDHIKWELYLDFLVRSIQAKYNTKGYIDLSLTKKKDLTIRSNYVAFH